MNILQRRGFCYLGHTFRKGGKPAYREKYLGKTIPDNIEEIKEAFFRRCLREEAFLKLQKIRTQFRREWTHLPESAKKKILLGLAIEFTYNTNALEGSTISLIETSEVIQRNVSPNKPFADVLETKSHADLFFSVIHEERPLSLALLLEWNHALFAQSKPDIAGRLRDYQIKVLSYRPPDWQDLPEKLKEFFSWMARNKSMHPVELAARAHYRFEKIHPFGDGNGRIGRLLIVYILKAGRYPLLGIEQRHRKQYLHAFTKSEQEFVQYFIRAYLRKFREYLA